MVLGIPDDHFMHTVLPALRTIHGAGHLRVVDLLFVHTHADGTAITREVRDVNPTDVQRYGGIAGDLTGLLTADDVAHLAGAIPPSTSAVIVLFEHTWALGLANAIRTAGGVCFAGGMVSPEVVQHVSAELAAEEAPHA
jgi:hypothetical protein